MSVASTGAYNPFYYQELIKAADINSIFETYSFNRLPRQGHNMSTLSDSVNIGTTVFRWAQAYIQSPSVHEYIEHTRVLVNNPVISTTVSEITYSGLHGNSDLMYEIFGVIEITCAAGFVWDDQIRKGLHMRINNDTQGYRHISKKFKYKILDPILITGSRPLSDNVTSSSAIPLGYAGTNATLFFNSLIYSDSSGLKPIVMWNFGTQGLYTTSAMEIGSTYYNMPDYDGTNEKEITSLIFYFFDPLVSIKAGSQIQIYAYRGES